MTKFIKFLNTIKYLKLKQIYFRLFYFIRNRYRKKIDYKYPNFKNIYINNLILEKSIYSYTSYLEKNTFNFLNLEKKFGSSIDWNYLKYGKLWTYNITYFDFLNQKNINLEDGLNLINDFIKKENTLKDAIEPFPISLRGINWIKFLTFNKIEDKKISDTLYKHYQILLDNLEYHLLGNHLLENGFSLLFGAYFFENEKLYQEAKKILEKELNEQVLKDGAHFELSPMYHQIMLFRVLDCINLVKNNKYKNQELLFFLKAKASIMCKWLENITFKNGQIPLLNDSSNTIAPSTEKLIKYAKTLGIESLNDISLKESGYRKISNTNYECIIDVGNIGPDYIPGHAHSDTFNFELHINSKPFIVDTGLSTYEPNKRRNEERSTKSHNTVEINEKDQSEVWGGFRVANRAKIVKLEEKIDFIKASHNGYKKDGILHTRTWEFKEKNIIIKDSLNKEANAIAILHFHPNITKEEILNSIKTNNDFKFTNYKYAPEFNILIDSVAIEIPFNKELQMEIKI